MVYFEKKLILDKEYRTNWYNW